MAREPEKSTRDPGKSRTEAAAKTGANEENKEDNASAQSISEFLQAQHRELQKILAKGSDANVNHRAIAEEFAALWAPHQAIEVEILGPALKNAGARQE
jgi:hypothetical protein